MGEAVERSWTLEEVDDQPGYGSENVAAYSCLDCGAVVPQTFVAQQDEPPVEVRTICPETWGGCGNLRAQKLVETVRWIDDE